MSTELTSRERQVMRLLAKGLSNSEIGRQLNASEATIKVHLCHIFLKLGVRNRTALAALAALSLPNTPSIGLAVAGESEHAG